MGFIEINLDLSGLIERYWWAMTVGDGEAKASTQDQDGEARGELLGFIGINLDLSGLIER